MYECAMRIGTEMVNYSGLQQQVRCYLATLNALRLVNPDYAWIVKPVLKIMETQLAPGMSPKHSYDGEIVTPSKLKPRLDVLELKDIEREFQLINARLKLANSSKNNKQTLTAAGPTLSANDVLTLLVASNLFTEAVKVAKAYQLDFRPIVEGLASRCVFLSRTAKAAEKDAAWDWLADNQSTEGALTSVEAAWGLLKKLMQDLETKGQSMLKKAVAIRLISLGHAGFPAWMISGYKAVNAAELLHLYLSHGYVLLAAALAVDYIY